MTRILLVVVLAWLMGCTSSSSPVAGGTSSTDNAKIAACVTYANGAPAIGARVSLRPATFLAQPDSLGLAKRAALSGDTITDDQGRFVVEKLDPGSYSIEVADGLGQAALVACDIAASSTTIDTVRLAPVGALSGTVVLDSTAPSPAFVQVYGLERAKRVDSVTGAFSLDDVPQGAYTVRVTASSQRYGATEVTSMVTPGSSVSTGAINLVTFDAESYADWAHSAVLRLNTTASGAGIAQDVRDFPLLVRLDASTFDFTLAQTKGFDIRCAKTDGTRLRYEIEQWDPVARVAALWVNIDTVRGNDSTQFIMMYWGNPSATDMSCGRAVFDTARGYECVYHLNENPSGDLREQIRDRTAGARHGTPGGDMTSANSIAGVAGRALMFDGVSDAIEADASYLPLYSFSLWVRADRAPFVCKDSLQSTKVLSYGHSNFEFDWAHNLSDYVQSHAHQIRIDDTTVTWKSARIQGQMNADTWYHIAGTYDGTLMTVYVNGALEQASAAGAPDSIPITQRRFVVGGYRAGDRCFGGMIDEVEVSRTAWNAAWIKLQYENQRIGSRLIRVE